MKFLKTWLISMAALSAFLVILVGLVALGNIHPWSGPTMLFLGTTAAAAWLWEKAYD